MWERWTREARRVVSLAHINASRAGLLTTATEHLLLGLLHEDSSLVNRFLGNSISEDSIRKQIGAREIARDKSQRARQGISFSEESKRVLSFASEEADLVGKSQVGAEHLLLGLLRQENCRASQILRDNGADLEVARMALKTIPHTPPEESERIANAVERVRKVLASALSEPL